MKKGILLAGVSLALVSVSWCQIPLAEQRVVTVSGQQRTLVSKMSKRNPDTTRLRTVMDLNFTYNYHHNTGKAPVVQMLNRFAADTSLGWTVSHYYYADLNNSGVDDRSRVTSAVINQQLVVFANHISNWASTGQTNNPSLNTAIQNYMTNNAGGLVILHGSGDSPSGGGWSYYYSTLHPVLFDGHGTIGIASPVFRSAPANNPVMENVMATGAGSSITTPVTWNGEWHRFRQMITNVNANAVPLIKADWTQCATCYPGSQWQFSGGNPIAWTLPVGRSMVGYFQEGHDNTTLNQMTQAVWDRFFKQMIFFVSGYDTLPLVGVAPRPDWARDRSGVSFNPEKIGAFVEGKHTVQILNTAGKVVMRSSHPSDYAYDFSEELNRSPGLYVMRVSAPAGIRSRKYLVH